MDAWVWILIAAVVVAVIAIVAIVVMQQRRRTELQESFGGHRDAHGPGQLRGLQPSMAGHR